MYTDPFSASHILNNLSEDNRLAVGSLEDRMRRDDNFLDKTCDFLLKKIGDTAIGHFWSLTPETKLQACVELIVIGLLSGDFTGEDIKRLKLIE